MAEHKLSDSLLQRVASGDASAVTACIDEFGGLVWSLARRLLDRASDAEDAVQEVFIEIWKNASRFDASIASETTFVAMIARRRLIDRRRRDARTLQSESLPVEDFPIAAPEALNQVDLHDEASKAAAALQQLKPDQRKVLQLSVCQGWPHQVIADRLGLPLGTVKTHVRRGLIKVREELGVRKGSEDKASTGTVAAGKVASGEVASGEVASGEVASGKGVSGKGASGKGAAE